MTSGHARHDAASGFAQAMAAAMDRMMHDMHAGTASGDPDRDFLAMMIPHHQGAIDMAELVLRFGRDPLVRQLAEDIIAAQRAEIASMQKRLDVLENRAPDDRYPALGGTRGKS
jgi:uncharacterized protein (DUF305 family)